ncbi:MAG: hypothetical protein BroJett011_44860 [Chloroflexota bacterium]|nr:MAG: hypothetical protein BroJett011_44860 [Chloroflexota bacterium]
MKKSIIGVVLITLLWPHLAFADSPTATYKVTFSATWSNQTHPHPDFPTATAHFSPLIGGIHNSNVKFWEVGQLASVGIERMAEQGQTAPLTAEVNTAIANGTALAVLAGSGVDSPGSTTINSFQVTKDSPLVTLVTMIAPTPDWFTGVSGVTLLDEQGNWVDSKVVMLYPYDAGTEQDGGFTLDNPPMPQNVPIASLSGTTFFTELPVGSFTFTRINYSNLHLNKSVTPSTPISYQGLVTYTLVLSNSGDTNAAGAVLTDTLPGGVTFARWAQSPAGAAQSSNQITWTGAVTASKTITFSFVATHTGALYGETITNTAVYSHSSGGGQASAAFTIETDPSQVPPNRATYLPFLLKLN